MSRCKKCQERQGCGYDNIIPRSKECQELRSEIARRLLNRKVCKRIGHDIVSDDWANSETGGIAGSCKRCDFEFREIFY